jgi:integrase
MSGQFERDSRSSGKSAIWHSLNVAIDSKLRGCDLVAIRVDDVAPNGYAIERASVRQRKTGRPVRFELTEQTRQAIDDYLAASGKKLGEYLFNGRRGGQSMSTRQYARAS